MIDIDDLNPDQRREAINTTQRFGAWRTAEERVRECRGSMTWSRTKGREYLLRSAYDKRGLRGQTSLGPRSPVTEQIKADYERSRQIAAARLDDLRPVMERQAAVNRAVGLGRVPLLPARVIRALDRHGVLGAGIRILGTNALYAYEAAAGVRIEPGLTTTDDVDLLLDPRGGLTFVAVDDVEDASLLRILRQIDASFERTREHFRAVNRHGYLVDLVKPLRSPPWTREDTRLGHDPEDLSAVEITGLTWHESAPAFEAVAIDERGAPLRMVATDPRVFAVHKLWLSQRDDREPIRRRRDRGQAAVVARLVASHLQHLRFEENALRMLPRALVRDAAALFTPSS